MKFARSEDSLPCVYLIDESSYRHDGFINTGFFARAKNYHAFAEPSLGFQIQGRVRNMYNMLYRQISIEKSSFFLSVNGVLFDLRIIYVESTLVCPPSTITTALLAGLGLSIQSRFW